MTKVLKIIGFGLACFLFGTALAAGYIIIREKLKDPIEADEPVSRQERPKIEKTGNLDGFIRSVCESEGVPFYFAMALLEVENPLRNPSAVHKNDNGTLDLGLWQLNSTSLFYDFIDKHWKSTEEFNWADPEDNTILAIRHIAWLYKFGFNDYQAAVAYNRGFSSALTEEIGTNPYALKVLRREVELLQEAAFTLQ